MKKKQVKALWYVLLFVFAALFIVVGYKIASTDSIMFTGQTGARLNTHIVRVDLILDKTEDKTTFGGELEMVETKIKYSCTVLFGENKGESFIAYQSYDNLTSRLPTPVRQGDWIIVYQQEGMGDEYVSGDIVRIRTVILVAAVFFLLLMIFGKLKGVATVVALGFSVLSIFLVFIPSILAGDNIYVSAIVICIYTIIITPFFIGGFNKKSVASALGSIGGVALAGVLSFALNSFMRITGAVDDETMAVAFIREPAIDLQAIVFAAMLIGALGACLDVSMSISASIYEMKELSQKDGFGELFSSGIKIGWDIMGTQISTLVLAYIGSSLSVVLLLVAYQNSLIEMLNREVVIIELLQSFIGCFTILFTIPMTAFISAAMFSRNGKHKKKRRIR